MTTPTFALVAVLGLAQVQASEHVYLVEATSCRSAPTTRLQSGFTVEGIHGIVTALHGVVGCQSITARSDRSSNRTYRDLSISLVDVDRDLAILRNRNMQTDGGIAVGPPPRSPGPALAIGHPSGVPGVHEMRVEIPSPALRRLSDLLPADLYEPMQKRGSPKIDVTVISINGDIQPGHSGGPILDESGRAIGVVNGGLAGGTLGIGWAAALLDAKWSALAGPTAEDLGRRSPAAVYAYSRASGVAPSDSRFIETMLAAQKECGNGNSERAEQLYREAATLRPDDPGVGERAAACHELLSQPRSVQIALHVSPGVFFKGKKNEYHLASLRLEVDGHYCGRLNTTLGTVDYDDCYVTNGQRTYRLSDIDLYDSRRRRIPQFSNGRCGGHFQVTPQISNYHIILCMSRRALACTIVPSTEEMLEYTYDQCRFP